ALMVRDDDADRDNNLGQKKTQVGKVTSPAKFTLEVHNDATVRRQFDLEADMYRLPKLPPCSEQSTPPRGQEFPSRMAESRARWERALRTQGFGLFPVTSAWRVTIEPNHFPLDPDQTQQVAVSIEPVSGTFSGRETFNIHGLASPPVGPRLPVGGVTLYVEGN